MSQKHELEGKFNPKDFEEKIYQNWEEKGYFKPSEDKTKTPYTIVIPPPNITGKLHMGHALDNTIQDILIRYKRMQGFNTLWVPGTDHAAIATEAKIVEKLKKEGISKEDLGREGFLEKAWEWKKEYGGTILKQLKKLGCSCDWDRERFTMDEGLSNAVKHVFVNLYNKGLIYKGKRMINWCPYCNTSISDAEVEYEEEATHLWHIRYPIKGQEGKYVVVATTRPETMLGDTGIAVNPTDERYQDLVGKTVILPIMNKEIPVIADEFVEKEFGTGCVKLTPAHDVNDYQAALKHNLEIVPVFDENFKMGDLAPEYKGMDLYEARQKIVERLEKEGYLVKIEDYTHNVGKCYRCHHTIEPHISEQWFVKMEPLAKPAIQVVREGKVKFVPERFDKIYYNWMENIQDWCISRQRTWGVPIPIFYCKDCGKEYVTEESIKKVQEIFREKGSNAWFDEDEKELMPEGATCPHCGCKEFKKETDIMDVWFDSGSSHQGVLVERGIAYPADLYLEGQDQYRGWFQSSMLTSVAVNGVAPYKQVLTHGFIVDDQGRKMSKSLGNGIAPQDIVKEYGADILRLWVLSSDFKSDVSISKGILKQISEVYRKIRNTARYILGNTCDYDPENPVTYEDLQEIDKWALTRLNKLIKDCTKNYENYDFHMVYRDINQFCVVDMSTFYLDIIKDRLYTSLKDSTERRAAQTTMYIILNALVKMLAPMTVYTAEEIWKYMPHTKAEQVESVMLAYWPEVNEKYTNKELTEKWNKIIELKDVVAKELELERANKTIGNSLDAKVTLYADGEEYNFLMSNKELLQEVFIVSELAIEKNERREADKVGVKVEKADGEKCERCWTYSKTVGEDKEYSTLCHRCSEVMHKIDG